MIIARNGYTELWWSLFWNINWNINDTLDCNIKDNRGWPALAHASASNFFRSTTKTVTFIDREPSDSQCPDTSQKTALKVTLPDHRCAYVCHRGQSAIQRVLLKYCNVKKTRAYYINSAFTTLQICIIIVVLEVVCLGGYYLLASWLYKLWYYFARSKGSSKKSTERDPASSAPPLLRLPPIRPFYT